MRCIADGPLHPRTDAEEVFCMLRGRVKLTAKPDGETWQVQARDRDLTGRPVGASKPSNPTYRPTHALCKVKR